METRKLAEFCKLPYAEHIVKKEGEQEKGYTLEFGFLPVRLPEFPDVPPWVVKGLGRDPLLFLTTERMRKSRKLVWRAVEAYLSRWRVEETIRFIKQSYELEDIRVLGYDSVRNLAMPAFACFYFAAVWLGTKAKHKVLVGHAFKAAKRLFGIPDFCYYAVADGIKSILQLPGQGPSTPEAVIQLFTHNLSCLLPEKNGGTSPVFLTCRIFFFRYINLDGFRCRGGGHNIGKAKGLERCF